MLHCPTPFPGVEVLCSVWIHSHVLHTWVGFLHDQSARSTSSPFPSLASLICEKDLKTRVRVRPSQTVSANTTPHPLLHWLPLFSADFRLVSFGSLASWCLWQVGAQSPSCSAQQSAREPGAHIQLCPGKTEPEPRPRLSCPPFFFCLYPSN